MVASSGMKDIQALIPIVGSGGGRQCGRGHPTICFEERNLFMGDMKQRNTQIERERERGTKRYNSINKNATVTNEQQHHHL